MPHCFWSSGKCILEHAVVIWNATETGMCAFEKHGRYEGQMSGTNLLVNSLQVFLNIVSRVSICGLDSDVSPLFNTSQGVLVKFQYWNANPGLTNVSNSPDTLTLTPAMPSNTILTETEQPPLSRRRRPPRELDAINIKLGYLEEKLMTMVRTQFEQVWWQLCQAAQRDLDVIWTVLSIDPTLAARLALRKPNVRATILADYLIVHECQTVTVHQVYSNFKVDNDCYEYMPVQTDHGLMFKLPMSQELVSSSRKLPCTSFQESLIQLQHEHLLTVSYDISWKANWSLPIFNKPPVFQDLKLLEVHYGSYAFQLMNDKLQALEWLSESLVNYTSQFSTNPGLVQESLRAIAKGTFQGIGAGVEHLLHGTGELIKDTTGAVSTLIKGPIQFIVNCLAMLLITAIVLYIGFRYLRCPKCRPNRNGGDQNSSGSSSNFPFGAALLQLVRHGQARSPTQPTTEGHVVNIVTSEKTPQATVKLNEVEVSALIDTGASPSLISNEVFQKCKAAATKLMPTTTLIVAVNSQRLQILGATLLKLVIGVECLMLPVIVAKQLKYQCILGTNLLYRFPALHFLWAAKLLLLGSSRIPLSGIAQPFQGNASMLITETIAPFSGKFVQTYLPLKEVPNETFFFEASPKFCSTTNLAVARNFCEFGRCENGLAFPVFLANFQANPVTVYARTSIGTVHIADEVCESGPEVKHDQWNYETWVKSIVTGLPKEATDAEKSIVEQLFQKYEGLFAKHEYDIGHFQGIKHHIELLDKNVQPCYRKPFSMATAERAEVDKHIAEQLRTGIIEHSTSPWGAPTMLVRKKSGGTRLVVDFRALNALTKNGKSFPLPFQQALLTSIGKAKFFTQIDVAWGFYNISLDEESRELTAFSTYSGHYQYKRLPMGLCGSPGTFQAAMNQVLGHLNYKALLLFMDDVLIPAADIQTMVKKLDEVFGILLQSGIKLRKEKCAFFKAKVQFLGHTISAAGVLPSEEKIKKVKEWPTPISKTEVRGFLGLCNFFRDFVPHFTDLALPLTALTELQVPFKWTAKCAEAFDSLKSALTTPPVLVQPDFNRIFFLATDASGFSVGSVLEQKDDNGALHPIGYFSHKLSSSQTRYTITEKEFYAIVLGLKHFRYIVYGYPVVILTDHSALVPMIKGHKAPADYSARFLKWSERIAPFQIVDVVYISCPKHTAADAMSRMPQAETCSAVEEAGNHVIPQIQNKQRSDPKLAGLINYLENGVLPDDDNVSRTVLLEAENYAVTVSGILVHVDQKTGETKPEVPSSAV